jgi:hypothetical protein
MHLWAFQKNGKLGKLLRLILLSGHSYAKAEVGYSGYGGRRFSFDVRIYPSRRRISRLQLARADEHPK